MSTAAKSSTREEQAIRNRTDEFVAAWNQHDPRTMAKVYAEDADLINPSGRVAKSRTEIEKLFKDEHTGTGGLRDSRMALKPEGIRLLTPDVAVGDYTFEVSGARDRAGKEMTMHGHLTLVLTKQGETWSVATCRPMVPVPESK